MQAGVPQQVFRAARRAVAGEVGRRADQLQLELTQFAHGQPRIHRLAGAQDHVEAFVDDIHHAVAEVEV